MTLMRPESAVLSVLLCDLPDTPAEVGQPIGAGLVRALGLVKTEPDPDFEESVRLELTESFDAYSIRTAEKWGAR